MNDLELWRKELQQYYNLKYFMESPSNWQELANAAVERDYLAEVLRRNKSNTLPEVTITDKGNSKPVNVSIESDLTPSELKTLSTPDKARTRYNDYLGRKYAQNAQHAANVVGGILAVPAAGIAAAPVIGSAGAYALNGLEAFKVAHPFMAATIDAGLAADGIRNLATDNGVTKTIRLAKEGKKGRAVLSGLGDVADATGMFDVVRLGKKIANPLYRAGHAYVNISPAGYENPGQRGKKYLEGLLSGKLADISKPKWEGQPLPQYATGYLEESVDDPISRMILANIGRDTAWRKYLGLPEKYKVYVQNPDGTFSYNMKMINAMARGNLKPILSAAEGELNTLGKISSGHGHDFVTGAGGGLTGNTTRLISVDPDGTKHGVQTIEDVWDLHPFSRPDDRVFSKWWKKIVLQPSWRLQDKIQDLGSNIGVDKKELKKWYDSLSDAEKEYIDFDPDMFRKKSLSGKIGNWLYNLNVSLDEHRYPKFIRNLDDKLANFEVGPILGGKPFTMKTEIPIKVIQHNPAKEPVLPIREEVRLDYKTGGRIHAHKDNGKYFTINYKLHFMGLKNDGKLNYLNFFK